MNNSVSRRDAIKTMSIALGGAVSASTIAGMFTPAAARAWTNAPTWAPGTLTAGQLEVVATMAEHIIPTTDTPGGRAAGVHRYVDALLTDYYSKREHDQFLAGLAKFEERAQAVNGAAFLSSAPAQQHAVMTEVDTMTYARGAARATNAAETTDLRFFFRRMKEVTLAGYYMSEVGATKELHVAPMGAYKGDIPYSSVGKTWA
jgi:hypothetical protein